MASSSFLLFSLPFTLLLTLTSSRVAAKKPQYPLPYNFTHVCEEVRYAKLGLQMSDFPFCNKSVPFRARAKNLVGMMTLAEKAMQLGNTEVKNVGYWAAVALGVERLGLPAYNWWSEALHGVSDVGAGSSFDGPFIKGATSFPPPISMAATFNQSLWKEIGQAVSTEARAMHNLGTAGLTFWSPNINLVRDPRWGRALETPGEDPTVIGLYAVNYVRGLQDVEGHKIVDDPDARPLKVSACCRHLAAYDVDHWTTSDGLRADRFHFDANVTERDMVESFLKPFEMCVKDGDVSSVMCSYNNINGIPACADAKLMRETIRGEWKLHGYIVSDCDSIKTMVEEQRFLDDSSFEATAQAMRGGLDLDCGEYYPKFLEETVKRGYLKESDVDEALINNYIVLLRLGWFDGNPQYQFLNASHVCSVENLKLAASSARQGMVLLKNKNDVLPLSPDKFKNIVVTGPHANASDVMIGNYQGIPCRFVPPIEGLKKYAEVDHRVGCLDTSCHNETYIFHAQMAATKADATIIVAGLSLDYEREDWDRTNFDLPGYQNQLIKRVSNIAKGPVVLVILSSGSVNISSFVHSDDVDAIIWAGYPGQEGGQAIADVVYGKYNPGGRLPVTWYPPEYLSQLPMTSMQFRPDDDLGYPGRTYRFYDGPTLFPFGFGLSYTSFTYEVVSSQTVLTKKINRGKQCYNSIRYYDSFISYIPGCRSALISNLDCKNDITVEVLVKNVGNVDGSDIVMLYSKHPRGLVGAPIKRLEAFERVFLNAGESKTVKFELDSCKSMAFVTESAYQVLPSGEHTFVVGNEKDEHWNDKVAFSFFVQLREE